MHTLGLVVKGLFYLLLVGLCTPLLWALGRSSDSFEGETFADYDDDDAGEDVDENV
jgi:hypothetical protein